MEQRTSGLKGSQDILKLIQPDLLTVEELTDILQERGVAPDLLSQSKVELVLLFRNVAFPLPQRDFHNTYRGSLITDLRKKTDRRRTSDSQSEIKSYEIGVAGGSKLSSNAQKETVIVDRLKPPPDLVNHKRKKIKLNKSEDTNICNSESDKIVITKRKVSENSNDSVDDKQHTSGTCSEELKNPSNGTNSISLPKKICLKRDHLVFKEPSSTSDDLRKRTDSENKRKPITWP